MNKPTGRLAFAYRTIADLEQKLAEARELIERAAATLTDMASCIRLLDEHRDVDAECDTADELAAELLGLLPEKVKYHD